MIGVDARVHDLRHHFAIRTLLNWYQSDTDVEAHLPELAAYLGHIHVRDSYWYLSAVPELVEPGHAPLGARRERSRMKTAATFSELLQGFFTDRLMRQCGASPLTIANYRDTFRLLIAYAQRCLKKPPTKLAIQDLDAPFIARLP